ncbi:adenylate/guanylate cyclase domain-containing protein [Thermodesulfobacteriota bacterium]
MPAPVEGNWITSQEVLEKTGISRATLNNYIKVGILPLPVVKRPADRHMRTKRIGHFPQWVLGRIQQVRRLKREGRSMEEIARSFREMNEDGASYSRRDDEDALPDRSFPPLIQVRPERRQAENGVLKVTLEDIGSPAYLINKSFQIEWINPEAEKQIFNLPVKSIRESDARNVFRLLFRWEFHQHVQNWAEIVAFHLGLAKSDLPRDLIQELYEGISETEVSFLQKTYDDQSPLPRVAAHSTHVKLAKHDGSLQMYQVHAVLFREGTFFVYVPVEGTDDEIRTLLSQRERLIQDLLGRRMPSMVSLCVLVADLQDSVKISAELPPADYFELINQLWRTLADSFEKYHGIYGKHAGDGLLYYFLKKPGTNYILDAIHCALELRRKMIQFSNEWKLRKGWMNEIYLNTGINEGKEFFGSICTPLNIEYTALGDTINYAGRLSDFARFGSIFITKNALNKLAVEELKRIQFGIRRRVEDREVFVKDTYSRIMDLIDPGDTRSPNFMDISMLPVTEILDEL